MKGSPFLLFSLLVLPIVAFALLCIGYSVFKLPYLPQIVNSSGKYGIDLLLWVVVLLVGWGFDSFEQ